MRHSLILIALMLGIASGYSQQDQVSQKKKFNQFCNYLKGTFSSQRQSVEDTSYFNISLTMYPIWLERTDGRWFYVEQAMASRLDKPYRQRVYRIHQGSGDTIISDIFTFENPLEFAGLASDSVKRNKLSYHLLTQKEGCSVQMTPNEDGFKGGTSGTLCASNLKGAQYTTTIISLNATQLLSWDRGFDQQGLQVWGATKGGYQFDKITSTF